MQKLQVIVIYLGHFLNLTDSLGQLCDHIYVNDSLKELQISTEQEAASYVQEVRFSGGG